jgi:hypothetical protein
MRVVAARFPEPSQASAARDLLQRELENADVKVAPLGHPGEAGSGDAVLAGRFPEEVVDIAVELVESAGGEIVADIDERYTGTSGASSGFSTGGSGGYLN